MLTVPSDINDEDLQVWLCQGYFLFNSPAAGDWVIGSMRTLPGGRVRDDAGMYNVHHLLSGAEEKSNDLSRLQPYWPLCGAVNYDKQKLAFYVTRLQKKQWKRTYNQSCVQMGGAHLTSEVRRLLRDSHNLGQSGVVASIFNPEYVSYQEILSRFSSGWTSCAMSPHIILARGEKVRVFYHNEYVGYIKEGVLHTTSNIVSRKLGKQFGNEVQIV